MLDELRELYEDVAETRLFVWGHLIADLQNVGLEDDGGRRCDGKISALRDKEEAVRVKLLGLRNETDDWRSAKVDLDMAAGEMERALQELMVGRA